MSSGWTKHDDDSSPEEPFRQLVDAISDYAVFLLDREGHVTTWNEGARRTKGYEASEILGEHFSIFYPPEDRATGKPEAVLDTVRREGRFEEENWRVRKDGTRFWASVVITALRGRNGAITGFAKVTRDLTERRRAEEERHRLACEVADLDLVARLHKIGSLFLSDTNQLQPVLTEIVETAMAIGKADFGNIQLYDPDTSRLRIVAQRGFPQWWVDYWNEASSRGACTTALVRRERQVVEDVDECPDFVGTPGLEVQRRAGVKACISTPIVGPSGTPLGVVSTHYRERHHPGEQTLRLMDILARQTADIIERVHTERAIAEASRAKDEFLATVSHELRTPLSAIQAWANYLRRNRSDPAKLEHGLEVIARSATAQARMVDDILDISRVISGKLRLRIAKTDLPTLVREAVDVVRPAAQAKDVKLVVDVDPYLSAAMADRDRLHQVVWNLLVNAVRFTSAGGTVTVQGTRTDAGVVLRVTDTGIGIAPEHLPHVFERFRQVDSSTTRQHGGMGLGLAIVRHLVEAHGGTVAVHSEGVGHGTAFTIRLPIGAVSRIEDARESAPGDGARRIDDAHRGPGLEGVRVLLVDDDPDVVEIIRMVLEEAGASVVSARTAREGLALLDTSGPIAVVVSDIGMPEMDGYAFMRTIRSRETGATVPAIALTAYARPQDEELAWRAGYQDHLPKPVDEERLLEAVKTWATAQSSAVRGEA